MSGILEAARKLNQMVNELGLKVYVHCTSSYTRSVTVVIVYLCLYLQTYSRTK